jgi:hypothetical protein
MDWVAFIPGELILRSSPLVNNKPTHRSHSKPLVNNTHCDNSITQCRKPSANNNHNHNQQQQQLRITQKLMFCLRARN